MSSRKFTIAQDKEIAVKYASGLSSIALAKTYGVDKGAILNALTRQGTKKRRSAYEPTAQDIRAGQKSFGTQLLTPSEAVEVAKIYTVGGYSLNKISTAYGFGKNGRGLSRALKACGVELRGGHNLTDGEDKQIASIYAAGYSSGAIALAYGMPMSKIQCALKKQQVKMRKHTTTYRHKVKYDTFDCIDTEEKAYWLGFIYAEGCVAQGRIFQITLGIKDVSHLERLKDFLGSTHNLYPRNAGGFGKYSQTVLYPINQYHLAQRLQEIGIVKGRGEFYKTENSLPQHLNNHFIRGFLDGDGCLRRNYNPSVTFVGQEDILGWIRKTFNENLGTNPNMAITRVKGIHSINFSGINQARKITNWLYDNATVWLDRKRQIANEWENTMGRSL